MNDMIGDNKNTDKMFVIREAIKTTPRYKRGIEKNIRKRDR